MSKQATAAGKAVVDLYVATKRLELRPFTFDDLDELASMLGDAEALVHWGPPLSHDESRSWIARNRKRYENDGFGRCAVILRSTGELAGDCGLIRTDVEGQAEVELGGSSAARIGEPGLPPRPAPRGGTMRSTRSDSSGSCRW